jgi:hypothetical protein
MDIRTHLRGVGTVKLYWPAFPPVGSILRAENSDTLWRVDQVVIGLTGIDIYCLRIADTFADRLKKAWETWTKPILP